MKSDKNKIQKFCLRQQAQICGVNIISGGNRKWQNHYLNNLATHITEKADSLFQITITRRRRTDDRHMGTTGSGLSEALPQGYIHQSSHKRQAKHLPCRH